MAPGNDSLTGIVGVIPVLHIILLGQTRGTGIGDVIVTQEFSDFRRGILVDEEPAPGLMTVGTTRVPNGDTAWLAREIGHVWEHSTGAGKQTGPFPIILLAFRFTMGKVLRDYLGMLVRSCFLVVRPQECDGAVPSLWK